MKFFALQYARKPTEPNWAICIRPQVEAFVVSHINSHISI